MGDRRRDSGEDYVPHLGPKDVERIRRWHESAYEDGLSDAGSRGQRFLYLGLELHVPPLVQPITGMSHLLGEAVRAEVRAGERVLDMGTGCGVNAIIAARSGADVVAVDINPQAVEATRDNADLNKVSDRMDVRLSDVFDAIEPSVDGAFDLVIFDPPYRWFEPRDLLEMATTDSGYRSLTRFVREVRGHLSHGGRVLLSFGSSGDLAYLQRLIAEEKFETEVVAQKTLAISGWDVEYVVYRLTP